MPDSTDYCPAEPTNGYPGGLYGCPGTVPQTGGPPPDGDYDGDGVPDSKDKCPGRGVGAKGGVTEDGCPDRDSDGLSDDEDGCPDQAANEYTDSTTGRGCPGKAPFNEPDTPAADGPPCGKKQPCIVFERRGLSEKIDGGYIDADATEKVTIQFDADGNPVRVVEVELRNVDSMCQQFDEKTRQNKVTPGPEVSVTLGSLALQKTRRRSAGGGFYTVFRFDPIQAIRTIKGEKYHLEFYMTEDEANEAQFSVIAADARSGDCTVNINGYNDRATDGVCTGDVQADERGTCGVPEVQDLADVYGLGQALAFDCGASFACPPAKNVDVKITVIKSVAKALGLRSTTISSGKAAGPKRTKLSGERGTYFFASLYAEVERKMKAKKVRGMTVTVSGTATGPDGVRRFSPTRVTWYADGNCGGRDLKIKKHLTYGGTCQSR